MRVYRSLEEIASAPESPRVIAIGTFDGVHLGHKRIIGMAVDAADELEGIATVVTFDPHPMQVLRPAHAPRVLTGLEQKARLVEEIGVGEMAVVPFDRELAELAPADFSRQLLSEGLGARQVMVGENFRFGKGGAGGPADLLSLGEEYGFSVTAISMIEQEGEVVSSTRIRDCVQRGQVERAAELLGRPYALEGAVVRGAGRGRNLGIPTANLEVGPEMASPALGVYVTLAHVDGGSPLPSVTSVGTNPTFEAEGSVRVETHIMDFSRGIYGSVLEVEFLARLRGQIKFDDPDELADRIRQDVEEAGRYFAEGTGVIPSTTDTYSP